MAEKKLNKEQLQAVKHKTGPLLIVAGAGTGKTTVITEKIKYLITSGLAKPEEILALTFTEKAVLEMETRVDEVMPLSYGDIWITTFHSFCDSILRESGLHIGLPTNFKLMTKEKSVDLFKRNLFNFSLDYFRPLGNPNKFIYSLLTHISRLQDELITPADYIKWVEKKYNKQKNDNLSEEEKLEYKKWKELAVVYKEYEDLKLKDAKFDFGDLIIKTVELFKKRPNVLRAYQGKFKYILVDEFQDTNYGQNELVNLLAQKHKNITVVGDDNQSIYRFRGASVSNIISFKEVYPDSKTITLNRNYRSSQQILDGAYKLIKNNDPDTLEVKLGISKKLISPIKNGDPIEFILSQNGDEEAEEVSRLVTKLVGSGDYEYKDIAILVRANSHADIFIKEFERKEIPHQFLGPSSLFTKEEIVDLISYLKSLYDPEETGLFYRLISSKFLKIRHDEIIKILSRSRRESISLRDLFTENNLHPELISLFNKHLLEINTKLTGEILFEFLNEMGIYNDILENEDSVRAKNISIFFQKIKSFENENPNARLREVVDYINLLTEVGESPQITNEEWQENNAVNILTVHSSKGLEFPIVFIVNLVSDRFPSRNRSDDLPIADELIKEKLPEGDSHLQEERRLMYVGATRAKEKLFLTASKFYADGKREKKISPFVFETLDKFTENVTRKDKSNVITFDKAKKKDRVKKISKVKINYLSVSQIETFENCPLHYLLKYIYNLPTPKTASISFGISIHETLKKFYENNDKEKFSEKYLLGLYEESFINEGFENKKHKEQFFKKGQDYLLGYFKNEFNKKIIPEKLEYKFTLNLFKDLKIGGTIDRVDRVSKDKLEVIDYKTGASIPTQKEVDKDLQLSIYALAVSDIYKVKPENIKLSLYYLDTQEKISTTRTLKELQEVKDKLYEYKQKIESSDFKCGNSYFCQNNCEFKMFCNKT